MTISYKYFKDKDYVLTTVSDQVTLDEALSHFDSLLSDININNPFYEIVNFSDVQNYDFGYYQSEQLMDKIIQLKNKKSYLGSCLVANKDIAKGMSNIFMVVGNQKSIDIQVFDTVEDSLAYIKSKIS